MHCAIYDTSLVLWFSRDLCLIGGVGGIVLHMKLIWCNGFPEICVGLEEERGGSIYHGYMCIVLYIYEIYEV